jgi:hypothetical protein
MIIMGTGFLEMIVGNVISVSAFGLMLAGVIKMFRLSSDIGEIKEILREMQREGQNLTSPASAFQDFSYTTTASHESPVALMQAANAEADIAA